MLTAASGHGRLRQSQSPVRLSFSVLSGPYWREGLPPPPPPKFHRAHGFSWCLPGRRPQVVLYPVLPQYSYRAHGSDRDSPAPLCLASLDAALDTPCLVRVARVNCALRRVWIQAALRALLANDLMEKRLRDNCDGAPVGILTTSADMGWSLSPNPSHTLRQKDRGLAQGPGPADHATPRRPLPNGYSRFCRFVVHIPHIHLPRQRERPYDNLLRCGINASIPTHHYTVRAPKVHDGAARPPLLNLHPQTNRFRYQLQCHTICCGSRTRIQINDTALSLTA